MRVSSSSLYYFLPNRSVNFTNNYPFFYTVLQEIEAEESLWHQKNNAASKTQPPAAKEPAPAAEPPKTSDEPTTESPSKRKAHFF